MITPDYTKIHNRFQLNGFHYTREDLKMVASSFIKEGDQYEQFMGDFLLDWLNPSSTIWIETSGTTSQPKRMKFKNLVKLRGMIYAQLFRQHFESSLFLPID